MSNQTPGNPFNFLPDDTLLTESKREEYLGLLGDRYVVLEIHRGGMGEVYICKSTSEDELRFALKTFQKRLFFDHASREAFVREVSIWMRLTGQPHILPALGLEQFNGQFFVPMLAVRPGPNGEITVRDLLEQQGELSPEEVLSFAFQMALGLQSAQKCVPGIIHGDLKPQNLLLIGDRLFISDFGLARVITQLHPEIQLEGTWAYQAPECWNAEAVISPACDIYSFGVVLYEFLTGRTPFHATTREEWSRAHREKQPRPPMDFPQEGVSKALMSLALHCLQKKPEDRPQDFAAVFEEIRQLALDYDDLEGFMLLVQSVEMKDFFETVRKDLKPNLIAALLNLQMYDLALQELDATPEELFTGELWRLRGNALSLSGRDEEALSAFERALQSDLTEDQHYLCLSNAALSLKRLNRFQEAIDVYNELLVQVPNHMQEQILSNLGTVYLESGQLEEAVSCFQLLTHEHPELPEGWANLGQTYRELGRYEEAVRCFQRALALAPNMAVVQVMLGEVYMDHLGRIEEAATALGLAWDQGYSSYDWFVRFLTCNLLLGRNEIVDQLIAIAQHDLTEAELSDLGVEIKQLMQKITGP